MVYLGEQAKEENVKKEDMDKFKYIHFATHSLIERKFTKRSGIVLSLDDDPQEDGILQMDEILNLKMDADLVVLSACQTGLGMLRSGEGIIGLTRAFMYAGTPSIVVSLWNINDRSTAVFMKNFYKYLMQGNDKSKALQLAKLDMLQSERPLYRHPFFWAPFVLIGDPE
jgi:CHAT domain-containing protein